MASYPEKDNPPKIEDGVCYCRDEGAYEECGGICPVHPPATLQEMREIVYQMRYEYYKLGYDEAWDKMQDALKEIMRTGK